MLVWSFLFNPALFSFVPFFKQQEAKPTSAVLPKSLLQAFKFGQLENQIRIAKQNQDYFEIQNIINSFAALTNSRHLLLQDLLES